MTEDDAFLADIIANPDDDGVRLIYADYLDERGDPRGEFIRVQIERARLPEDDPRQEPLATRERWLLAADAAAPATRLQRIKRRAKP
jgi:uncharacterized protein (TIGR02996 family)